MPEIRTEPYPQSQLGGYQISFVARPKANQLGMGPGNLNGQYDYPVVKKQTRIIRDSQ